MVWYNTINLKKQIPEPPEEMGGNRFYVNNADITMWLEIKVETTSSKAVRAVEEFIVELDGLLQRMDEKYKENE